MNKAIVIIMALVCGLAVIFIVRADRAHSAVNDEIKYRKPGIQLDSAKMEREYVKVEIQQLRELIDVARANDADFENLGNPCEKLGEIQIDLKGLRRNAKNHLMGNHEHEYWDSCYVRDSHFHFRYDTIGDDTVVDCPAYVFTKLVILNEPKR